ncbi:MAG TPA: TetR/AcrR family transcriptional regulator [Alphaproteobacteria bacterium]|jgi:AcrR family transcriptional regulator|nr:TetR/AcrR family transcriptional regulator [Alphaproteobacteria bacterium]MDP6269815.1 TetR/AcrR family transcriptional regulator [Alphaproteobacteria bacterium]MDP7163726.1 TetR/AcrR family transcriptional regulator [Alphaproteobacteria bacterium]MDP7427164.1 TetR/AcrR family transcriptional regulator [Alphaproteobacteria bacterium]HJM50205.1 TetR/AcrR family transcriptional regulator [Alphaproteobacteria bacterium]
MQTETQAPSSRVQRGKETRERLLQEAEQGFAARGFYGTSLRDMGRRLGMPNASLLHHFSSKAAIYAAVLERIAESLEEVYAQAAEAGLAPDGRVMALADALLEWTERRPHYAQIVMRELMDNVGRTERVEHWIFGEVLHRMAGLVDEALAGRFSRPDAMLFLFHMIGSISYFQAGLPTLAGVTGRSEAELAAAYHLEIRDYLSRALGADG